MLTVYHGSTYRVEQPLAGVCRPNLDFGVGFYLTDLKEQAVRWALFAQLIFAMRIVCGSIFIHWI